MISRLSAYAATFAVLAAASIAFAASAQQARFDDHHAAAAAKAMPVVQLETIVVTGHRPAVADQQ